MVQILKSDQRGVSNLGWLNSRHSFSFGGYYDPRHVGCSVLRVINEDIIDGGKGFGTHPHRDMEILSFVIDGALEHRDSEGNRTVIRPGEIQRMSAGTGIEHSEINAFKDQKTHFLQIWVLPDGDDYKPSYAQMNFTAQFENSNFVLLASKEGREKSITINQNIDIFLGRSEEPTKVRHIIRSGRSVWIQIVKGEVTTLDQSLSVGDGVAIAHHDEIHLDVAKHSEFILFDMPI